MSKRPLLSPMSSLLPAKGAAAIPEQIEGLSSPTVSQPASRPDSQLAIASMAEQRVNVSVRLPHSIVRRLREAAFRLEREKQDVVADALDEWLTGQHF
jgi:hypothetical protein